METIFYSHIKENTNRLALYNKGISDGKIQEFNLELLAKLKKTIYGGIPGNIYLYAFPTNFETIGNKIEILAWVFKNEKYKIIHANTNSTKEIMFYKYNSKHLDFNSWIEVKNGPKEYVIDPFSMLMIEKELYYEIENPEIIKVITSDEIDNHSIRSDIDFSEAFASYDSLLILMDTLEQLAKISPYKKYLEKEIEKLKAKVDYNQMKLDYLNEIKKK